LIALDGVTFEGFETEQHGYVLNVRGNGTRLVATHVTIQHNRSTTRDGALYVETGASAFLDYCRFFDNSSNYDAGIWKSGAGSLVVDHCSFESNSAQGNGGALTANSGSNVAIANSFFANNTAGGHSGAIQVLDNTVVNIANVTLVDNQSVTGGGGIHAAGTGQLDIVNTTLVGNHSATGQGHNLWVEGSFRLDLINSLLAGTSDNCNIATPAGRSLGGNVSDTPAADCAAGPLDRAGVDPEEMALGAPGWNGGAVQTVALRPASVAIDAAVNLACPDHDARGLPRLVDGGDGVATCDAGAFELQ